MVRCLRKIEVDGCAPDACMTLRPVRRLLVHVEPEGVPADALWQITTPGCPARLVRLFRGGESLRVLLARYVFTDEAGCAYTERPDEAVVSTFVENGRKAGLSVAPKSKKRN